MGPKLMDCCKPEQVGTREHGKMLKRIQVLEDGCLRWEGSWRKKVCGISREKNAAGQRSVA